MSCAPTISVSTVSCRVDDLYAFFVQWSPDVYGKEAREQGFVVVEKDELDMIDNFFSDPASCSWEVSSSRHGVASAPIFLFINESSFIVYHCLCRALDHHH